MARIPLGNFGNVIPQAAQGRVIDTGSQQLSKAVSNLGQAINNYGEVKNKLQDQEDEHQYNLEVPRYKAEVEETYKAINQDVATGVLTPDEGERVWGEKSASMIESYKARIPPSRTKQFEELGASTYYGGVPNLRDTGFKIGVQKQQTEAAISVEATLKNPNREEGYTEASLIVNNPKLGYSEAQRTEKMYEWNNKRDVSDASGVIDNAVKASDIDSLKAVEANIDKTYPYLTVEQRDSIKGQIGTHITRIQKRIS
ncbi:hypothetical protein [Acinetobacter oleivorans]|uniref:hypothetical protein n=1 Tax=Acinetobacter oleivorans TaxID=1148157 RepID=UPI00158065EC|nr:hypothetical protein [Acinetobacter oleivorans]NUF10350.1 hypothetical protein [Acinetobacter oleivorans]